MKEKEIALDEALHLIYQHYDAYSVRENHNGEGAAGRLSDVPPPEGTGPDLV
jgi:hypothetical protein